MMLRIMFQKHKLHFNLFHVPFLCPTTNSAVVFRVLLTDEIGDGHSWWLDGWVNDVMGVCCIMEDTRVVGGVSAVNLIAWPNEFPFHSFHDQQTTSLIIINIYFFLSFWCFSCWCCRFHSQSNFVVCQSRNSSVDFFLCFSVTNVPLYRQGGWWVYFAFVFGIIIIIIIVIHWSSSSSTSTNVAW